MKLYVDKKSSYRMWRFQYLELENEENPGVYIYCD